MGYGVLYGVLDGSVEGPWQEANLCTRTGRSGKKCR